MMTNVLRPKGWLGLALSSTLTITGCVTTGDLDQLNQRLAGQITAMEEKHQVQFSELHAELKDLRTANDALRGELSGVAGAVAEIRADSRSVVEAVREGDRARAQTEKRLQAEIARNREGLASYAGQSVKALDRIVERTGELGNEVKSLRAGVMEALIGTYRTEEAALQERLKAVSETRQRLESMSGEAREVDSPSLRRSAAQPSGIEQAQADE